MRRVMRYWTIVQKNGGHWHKNVDSEKKLQKTKPNTLDTVKTEEKDKQNTASSHDNS